MLVDDLGADHSPQDRWGGTPLNDAYRHRHEPEISYLKQNGATLGSQATAGDDPATELCEAAAKADVDRLRWLVREKGYDVNSSDYDKRTAIHLACSEGNLAVIKVLIEELGADHSPQDRWGGTPLNDAIRHRHEPVILHLHTYNAKLGNVSTVSGDPATELCNAAAKADVKELSFLVRMKRFDVNVGDYDKRTAIHL